MEKSENSKYKDFRLHDGLIWVKDPSRNIRQSSGVQFGGIYMTLAEYIQWLADKEKKDEE